jgi:23S rRNA G2069 N7-methylase RlmK/C1962 C5-methylase RlmI
MVEITRRGAERLQKGHLWIYRGDVAKAPGASAGDVVAVVDGRRRFLAKAWWSEKSQIALRVVTRDEEPVDEAFLAARLASALELRQRTFPGETAWRLVHGEADLLPGLVVDRFGPLKGTVLMRCYACCYGQGRHGVRNFRRRVGLSTTPEDFMAAVEESFPRQ